MACQNKELRYLRAVVTMSDLNAKNLFESCGFTVYGIEKCGIKEGSRYFDQIFMARTLRE
jgi:hypothetical protein